MKLVDSLPTISAKTPTPASQPASPPSSPRSVWPTGDESSHTRGGRASVPRIRPLPTSRLVPIAPAAPSSKAAAAAGSSSTAGVGPANARSSATQPSGVAQRSQARPVEVSATTRSANAAAKTAVPSASARRRVEASWLTSAPTPANTGTGESVASAR